MRKGGSQVPRNGTARVRTAAQQSIVGPTAAASMPWAVRASPSLPAEGQEPPAGSAGRSKDGRPRKGGCPSRVLPASLSAGSAAPGIFL